LASAPTSRPSEAPYLEKVRRLTARLSARDIGPDDTEGALAAVAQVLPLDVEAPTSSPTAPERLAKAGLKRAVAWYMRYLAEQVNDLGFALLRAGQALSERAGGAERKVEELERRLSSLEERVGRLENAGAQGPS
jgi:hypothetical protein